MGSIEYLPHTADAEVVITADSREELFVLGARALYTQVLDYDTVTPTAERRLTVTAPNLADLFHSWLSELLFLLDAEGWVAKRFGLTFEGDRKLTATLEGEDLDVDRHHPHGEVKSVTYGDYVLEARAGGGYRARVLFDV